MQESRKKEIRILASDVREQCNVGRYGIIDLFRECERMGYKLLRYPLGEDVHLGFVMKRDGDTVIFTNTCSRLSREIFTLAHEIGHALLHMEKELSYMDDTVTISGRSKDEKEKEANYFAVCLLMPADKVDKFLDLELEEFVPDGLTAMDIARMMSEFQVSFETAINRLESMGKISEAGRVRLDCERNQKRVGNLLRSVGGNSKLNEASQVIGIPYEYIDYVIYNYNHNAVPMETLEKVLACYELTVEDISDRLVMREEKEADLDALIGGMDE